MKKKKTTILTLPTSEIFADFVMVDFENRAIYDKTTGLSVGYIIPANDRINIVIKPALIADSEYREVKREISKYFNPDYVTNHGRMFFYRLNDGNHLMIGRLSESGIMAELTLPRVAPTVDNDGSED